MGGNQRRALGDGTTIGIRCFLRAPGLAQSVSKVHVGLSEIRRERERLADQGYGPLGPGCLGAERAQKVQRVGVIRLRLQNALVAPLRLFEPAGTMMHESVAE